MVKTPLVCRHKDSEEIFRYGNVPVLKCKDCDLVYTPSRRKNLSSKFLYRDYYKNEIPTRFRFGLEYVVRLFRFFRAYKLCTIYPKAKSILDIGSGRGFTLYYLKKYYHFRRTVGTQLCKSAVKFSRRILGLDIIDKDLLKVDFSGERFDLVTSWHVLEHVTKPEEYLKKISLLLERNGKLVIEVPNYSSWTRKFTGKYWLGLDLEYHLTFFTPATISRLLKKYKFRIINIHTFSLEYSIFLSVQSIVSKITKTDHVFFRWLQTENHESSIVLHLFLFALLTPICFLINLSLFYSKRGEVLLIVAENRS